MIRRWQLVPRDYEGVRARRKDFRAFLLLAQKAASNVGMLELVFGELVTNAVRYGTKPMWVTATVRAGKVCIDVEDSGDCFDLDDRLSAEPQTESGRGLAMVRTLVDSLIVTHSPGACVVTATLIL